HGTASVGYARQTAGLPVCCQAAPILAEVGLYAPRAGGEFCLLLATTGLPIHLVTMIFRSHSVLLLRVGPRRTHPMKLDAVAVPPRTPHQLITVLCCY